MINQGVPKHRHKLARGAAIGCVLVLAGTAADADSTSGMGHGMPMAAFAFGQPADPAQAGRVVNITMGDMSFTPGAITVPTGETVRFVVTNSSAVDHDFTIGDAATQSAHRAEMLQAMQMANMQMGGMGHHGDPNAMLVAAGETRELTWTFTRPGGLEFDCYIPGH
jgi:uncharacterized cupredoxin-like copper-binding protein